MSGGTGEVGNQCDGCKRGLPLVDGVHYAKPSRIWGQTHNFAVMVCTKDRYAERDTREEREPDAR